MLSADPCGSSGGSAISVAANMVAVSLGTETDGSILCPASVNSAVGIKPTVGLTSRAGVIPITPRQDTVGYVMYIILLLNSIKPKIFYDDDYTVTILAYAKWLNFWNRSFFSMIRCLCLKLERKKKTNHP